MDKTMENMMAAGFIYPGLGHTSWDLGLLVR